MIQNVINWDIIGYGMCYALMIFFVGCMVCTSVYYIIKGIKETKHKHSKKTCKQYD